MAFDIEISKRTYVLMVIQTAIIQIVNGIMENYRSMMFPALRTEFELSYDSLSYIQAILGYLYVGFGYLATICAEKTNCKITYLIGLVSWLIGCVGLFFSYQLWLVIVFLIVIWFGMGFIHIANNALTTVIFVKNKGVMISYTHFIYGIGTFLSPIISSNVNPRFEYGFRSSYFLLTAYLIIAIIYVSCVPYDYKVIVKTVDKEKKTKKALTSKELIKHPHLWLFALTDSFIMLLSYCTLDWGLIYLEDMYGWDPNDQGATFMKIFTLTYTIGRIIFSCFYQKIGYFQSVLIFLFLSFVLYVIGFAINESGVYLLACTGLFIGPLWPLIVCCCMEFWEESAPSATSLMITVQGLFKEIFNLMIGYANQYINNTLGYRLTMVFSIIGIFGIIWLLLILKKKRRIQELEEQEIKKDIELAVVGEEQKEISNNAEAMKEVKSDEAVNNEATAEQTSAEEGDSKIAVENPQ